MGGAFSLVTFIVNEQFSPVCFLISTCTWRRGESTVKWTPFKSIYDMCGPCTSFTVKEPNNTLQLVFQMTVRMDNLKAIEEIQALYWKLEKSTTPTTLLLPWFPGPAKKRKEQATMPTKNLFIKLQDYELKKNADVPSSDAIFLLERGLATAQIVDVSQRQFILSFTSAGIISLT